MSDSPLRPLPGDFFRSRSQRDVLVSPHFDDVCFSLGSMVARGGGGKLLTLFTQSSYLENRELSFVIKGHGTSPTPAEKAFAAQVVSRLRLVEDDKFCQGQGLTLFLGGLIDAPLRGRHPLRDTIRSAALDTPLLSEAILNNIRRLGSPADGTGKPWLFCPMAIGNHIDHLIVRNTIIQNLHDIRAAYRLAFYEDLPYSSEFGDRADCLNLFPRLLNAAGIARYSHMVEDEAQKLSLMSIYASQFAGFPRTLARFSPDIGRPSAAHEALWIFDGDL